MSAAQGRVGGQPGPVGIIANPASSKDIRRLTSHATLVPNHEKVNIVRRILLGLAATSVRTVWYMPDAAGLVAQAGERLDLPFELLPLPGVWHDHTDDTTQAARLLAERGAACMITLGGDGTSRAAVKGSRAIPLLPISTGTNNAFPLMIEGTLAGLAAGAVATLAPAATTWAPVLEIWRGEHPLDVALVDVAAFAGDVGSRAIWELDRVPRLITTRLRPGTVGLSALGGHLGLKPADGAVAVALELGPSARTILAPIAPGVIERIGLRSHTWLWHHDWVDLPTPTTLALDGERELVARAGETWRVRVIAHGVQVVDVQQALQAGVIADAGSTP